MRIIHLAVLTIFLALFTLATDVAVSAESYDELMEKARLLRQADHFEEAADIYKNLIAANPDDTDALVGRGFCLLHRKAYNEAKRDFQSVIEKAPSYIDAYYGLAILYKRTGKWKEVKATLDQAFKNSTGNEKSLNYLADICWRLGYLSLARSIDKKEPAARTRELKGYLDELYFGYTHDFLKKEADWNSGGVAYYHHFRPDINAGLSFESYRRNETNDHQIGIDVNYRYDMNLSLEYIGFFSTEHNFLAIQKHHPVLYYNLPSSTLIGTGVRFDEYENGWAKVGSFSLKQYYRSFYGEYTIHAGNDNFERPVTTQIFKAGYEKDNFYFYLGYSRGSETLDSAGGSIFSNQFIETVFFGTRYLINKKYGLILAGGPEYRDSDLFRTTMSVTFFVRF
jgi:YaiO family outer membrane protein